jgi:CubicO group peptidase (beta-lactamase class C family)
MMTEVGGTIAPGFEGVREAFAEAQGVDAGGAQLCVYRAGERVVDLWAGWDATNQRPYGPDTLTVLMSCTKAMTAICAHILAERGEIDLEAPIARVWPRFAAAGKGEITLAQVLSHTSGLAAFDPAAGIDAAAMLDRGAPTAALAAMSPLWPPGSAAMYHFVTFGFLVGEVVRRVSGVPLGAFFAREIAGPLGLDLWIGLPASEERRVAHHIRPPARISADQWRRLLISAGVDPENRVPAAMVEAFTSTDELIGLMNTPEGHAAEVPAGNGIGNARSLARAYAATIGEVDGVRLLSAQTVDRARRPLTDALRPPAPIPAMGGEPQRFGLGFELPRGIIPMLGEGSFGHPGAGGRLAFADPESGYAVAFVCNNMLWDNQTPDPRWAWNAPLREIAGRQGQ